MRVLIRVRYGECDAQGVLFNARYMDLVDVAFTEFERVVWGGHAVLLDAGLDTQVVSMKIDWTCLLYTSPSPRDRTRSRMPSSA